jgi:ribosome-binding factor A
MTRRTERLNELLREELSELLRSLKDPRLDGAMITITEVDVAPDLRRATVYVSFLGENDRDGVLAALNGANRHLHTQLLHRLAVRRVPDFTFRFDPSIERGARLATLIQEVSAGHEDGAGP